MSEYKSNDVNFFFQSKFAKDVMNNIKHNLNITSSRSVVWIYEQQTFDGADEYGPKSIVYNLFIVVYDQDTKVYSCYVYNTEDYQMNSRNNNNTNYYLIGEYTSDKFAPVKSWREVHVNYKSKFML